MSRDRGRILVIRGGAIGDFILTLPAIQALRTQFPQTRIDVLAYPHIGKLALINEIVDEVRSIESRQLALFFSRNPASLDESWTKYFESCNIVISYLYDPDELFQTNVGKHVKGQFIAGPHRPDESNLVHATDVFLEPLQRLAIFDADPVPRLILPRTATDEVPILAMHPGSGGTAKNWPREKWLSLARLLARKTNWHFRVIGGEAEGEFLPQLACELPPDRTLIVRQRPLDELAGILRNCHALLGHDSGISHLAAAVGTPVLALWGPTKDSIWRPRSDSAQLLRSDAGIAAIDPWTVYSGLTALLNTNQPKSRGS